MPIRRNDVASSSRGSASGSNSSAPQSRLFRCLFLYNVIFTLRDRSLPSLALKFTCRIHGNVEQYYATA